MFPSVIEGLTTTTRHEHKYEFVEATTDATWFACTICNHPLQEPEDCGTGA